MNLQEARKRMDAIRLRLRNRMSIEHGVPPDITSMCFDIAMLVMMIHTHKPHTVASVIDKADVLLERITNGLYDVAKIHERRQYIHEVFQKLFIEEMGPVLTKLGSAADKAESEASQPH